MKANWELLRKWACSFIFIVIAICCSILGFLQASKWSLTIGVITFCAMAAYDIFLAHRFPNPVLYVVQLLSIFFSIALLLYMGIASSASIVSKDKDPYQATLERHQKELSGFSDILNGLIGGAAINANNDVLNNASESASQVIKRTKELQDKELDHAKEMGEYSTGYLLAHKWLANFLEIKPDEVTSYILVIFWVAILSIQTVCSAYVHGREIHRPSFLGGIRWALDSFFDLRGYYEDKKTQAKTNNSIKKEDNKGKDLPRLKTV